MTKTYSETRLAQLYHRQGRHDLAIADYTNGMIDRIT